MCRRSFEEEVRWTTGGRMERVDGRSPLSVDCSHQRPPLCCFALVLRTVKTSCCFDTWCREDHSKGKLVTNWWADGRKVVVSHRLHCVSVCAHTVSVSVHCVCLYARCVCVCALCLCLCTVCVFALCVCACTVSALISCLWPTALLLAYPGYHTCASNSAVYHRYTIYTYSDCIIIKWAHGLV